VFFLGTSEEQVSGPLPEAIADNLYGLHIWEFDSLERFPAFAKSSRIPKTSGR
jgi:hypothetical protein